jgi:hypothetical protein
MRGPSRGSSGRLVPALRAPRAAPAWTRAPRRASAEAPVLADAPAPPASSATRTGARRAETDGPRPEPANAVRVTGASVPARQTDDCRVPYTLDAKGIRIPKAECY